MKHHSKRLLDRVRDAIRLNISSVRTEEAYADWIKRFILFHDKRHPQEMGYSDVRAFLLHLATKEGVAASTQNQALNALLFLYREVLEKDLDGPIKAIRAKSAKRVPTVLTLPRVLAVASRKCSPSSSAYRIRTAWPHNFSTAACHEYSQWRAKADGVYAAADRRPGLAWPPDRRA